MRAPEFWARKAGPLPRLLAPAAALYRLGGMARQRFARSRSAGAPVLCVGNLVAGGAGKTPVAIALALRLRELGVEAQFLTRGYGGRERGPLRVDRHRHDHRAVGDEALLLAETAPTWVGRDRLDAARAAVEAGAEALVLDDGFQDPRLRKDLSVLVVDGGYGFGNGRLIPAGPLREPLRIGLARADAVVLLGPDDADAAAALPRDKPLLRARLSPLPGAERFRDRDVLAFAGIGRPAKFFDTLREIGCRVTEEVAFPDHHRYRPEEVMAICERATRAGAVPVTTRKDHVRLPPEARRMVETVDVAVAWADRAAPDGLLASIPGYRAIRTDAPA